MTSTSSPASAAPPGIEKVSLEAIERPHPLANEWTLFCDTPSSKRPTTHNWSSSIRQVATVSSLEQFYALFQDFMPKISTLAPGSSLHFFKDKIEPEWEHPGNKGGGRWTFALTQHHLPQLDGLWMNMLLALIGKECPYHENICGVIVGIKLKQIKVSIWLKEAKNEKSAVTIGEFIQKYIGPEYSNQHMEFQPHPDASNPSSSDKSLYHI